MKLGRYPINITPSLEDPQVGKLSQMVGSPSEAINIPVKECQLPYGNCYWNVEMIVERDGGTAELGWLIQGWPGIFIFAQHHSVWGSPQGDLFDVTDKIPTDPVRDRSVFIPDGRIPVDLERIPNIRGIHLALSNDRRVMEYIDNYHRYHGVISSQLSLDNADSRNNRLMARGMKPVGSPIDPLIYEQFHSLLREEHDLKQITSDFFRKFLLSPPNREARAVARDYEV